MADSCRDGWLFMQLRALTSRVGSPVFVLVSAGLFFSSLMSAGAAGYVAGVEPDKRRADIAVITEVKKDAAWQKRALTGVSEPTPKHVLQFLDNQGSWFNPFLHRGMPGLYDIRGWYKSEKK